MCPKSLVFVPAYAFSTGVTMQYSESIILTRLSSGPRSEIDLSKDNALSVHMPYYLSALQEKGYVIQVDKKWMTTQHGLKALAEYKNPRSKSRQIVNSSTKESYDGAELRSRVQRRGAYDFLKFPSKMGDVLVYRPDAV
jgi:hypothetical protein